MALTFGIPVPARFATTGIVVVIASCNVDSNHDHEFKAPFENKGTNTLTSGLWASLFPRMAGTSMVLLFAGAA